jgi:hypothetical protein
MCGVSLEEGEDEVSLFISAQNWSGMRDLKGESWCCWALMSSYAIVCPSTLSHLINL